MRVRTGFAAACAAAAATIALVAPAQAASAGFAGTFTIDSAPNTSTSAADTQPGPARVQASCDSAPDAQWQLSRFTTCWHAGLTYIARDIRTGRPVGEAKFTITQETELNPNGTAWTENVSLLMVPESATGVVTTMLASWTASCSSKCTSTKSTPFPVSSPIAEGQTLSGTFTYSNTQAKGSVDNFQTSYTLQLVSPGSVVDSPVRYSAPPLRCDYQVGSTAGCVVRGYVPTFNVDSIEFPAAAAGVRWAQDNLPTHPGKQGAGSRSTGWPTPRNSAPTGR
jgi:hypothetical protein